MKINRKVSVGDSDDGNNIVMPFGSIDEYFNQPVRFKDCENHYELIYTGEFESVGRESIEITRVMQDLKDGNKEMELHIFISSVGGSVENLSLLLQQVLQYQHRVTICCGSALSAGFILWACGHERYVSPYSELMYHTIYSGYEGKGVELSSYGNHVERLTDKIMEAVSMKNLISEEDMQRGKSTEVWYTGEDFISQGKAMDYNEYPKRTIPIPVVMMLAGGRFFVKSDEKFVELIPNTDVEYEYQQLVSMSNEEVEVKKVGADTIEINRNTSKNRSKKSCSKENKQKIKR